MAFDPTIGGNSYASVEEANDYFDLSFHGKAVWDSVGDKEASLATASRMMDWYTSWKGTKVTHAQLLHFPAKGVRYTDGTVVPEDSIPREVKESIYELAVSNVSTNRIGDDDLAGIQSVKAGPLSLTATGSGSSSTDLDVIPSHVSKIVKELVSIYNSSNVTRLTR